MKTLQEKIIIIFLILIATLSCKEIKLEEETVENFSISLGEFSTYEEADIFKTKVDFQLWRELQIKKISERRFMLLYGNFESSYDAGRKAFELYSNSLINYYKIYKGNDYINDDFANILFVAKYQGRLSLYKFNLLTKQTKLSWSQWGRKVLALNHSKDRSIAFITTALGFGKQGSFPYVRDPRLYIYRSATDQVDEIDELGSGLQLYTYWENEDTFKINITKPDSINTSLLIQEILLFDTQGIEGIKKIRKFSLIKDGFPKPPIVKPALVSPIGNYELKMIKEGSKNYIYLRDVRIRSEIMIAIIEENIVHTRWTDGEGYVFIVLEGTSTKKKKFNKLIIVNLSDKNIIKNFIGSRYQNSLVQGNLLFFDEQNNGNSLINIYDFVEDSIYYKIQMPGGCGINNLLN